MPVDNINNSPIAYHAMVFPPKVSTRLYSFTLSPSNQTCRHATELLRTCSMMGHIMFPLRQYNMPSMMPIAAAKNTCAGFMCIRPKSTALTRIAVGTLLLRLSICAMMPQRNIISSPIGAPMAWQEFPMARGTWISSAPPLCWGGL